MGSPAAPCSRRWTTPTDERGHLLSVAKPAAASSKRLGSLIINPGGPGGSGVGYVGYFNAEGLEDYDIVGWDPRGSVASTPVVCYGAADLDRYWMDSSPDDPADLQARIDEQIKFGQSRLGKSGSTAGTRLDHGDRTRS